MTSAIRLNAVCDAPVLLTAAVLGIGLLVGCGAPQPERAEIDGQVTFQGEPVDFGHIVFIPIDGWDGFYSQTRIINGAYSMEEHGPIVGKNRVEIHGHRKTGERAPDISGMRLNEPIQMSEVTRPYLPSKYNVASEIIVEIKTGENESVDFNLE